MRDRVLITGGAGFIGSWLADSLLRAGRHVAIIDIQEPNAPVTALAELYPETFEYHQADLVYSVPEIPGVTEVYHIAGAIGTKQLINPAFDVLFVNIAMMRNLLNVYGNSIRKVVFTSTAEVYTGTNVTMPTDEKVNIGWQDPYNPRWAYAQSKFICELLLRNFEGKKHTPEWSIARLSNVYGPGMQQDYVCKAFIRRLKSGEDPLIVHSYKDTRPFTYVTDTIECLRRMMENDKANGQIINVANRIPITIEALADEIINVLGFGHYTCPPMQSDPELRSPNINKAYVLLDWQAQVSFKDGIKKTVEYYK